MNPTKLYQLKSSQEGGLRRVGTSEGEIVLFNMIVDGIYHAQVITWDEILNDPDPAIRKKLIRSELVDKNGKILS